MSYKHGNKQLKKNKFNGVNNNVMNDKIFKKSTKCYKITTLYIKKKNLYKHAEQ